MGTETTEVKDPVADPGVVIPAAVPAAAPVDVVVSGTPVAPPAPTTDGITLAERMNALDAQKELAADPLADRLSDSGLGYYDDVLANRRYITKLNAEDVHTVLGTPIGQIRRLLWPEWPSLEGISVLREDGSFYSIPASARSLGDVVDPVSGEALVGPVDPAKQKAREEAAAAVPLRAGDTAPVKAQAKAAPAKAKAAAKPKAGAKAKAKGK